MKGLPFVMKAAAFFIVLGSFTSPCQAKQMNILVHPFENTGKAEFLWISAGMTDTVISDLARIKDISVVSNADRKKILEEMKFIFSGLAEKDKMIKLGKLTGANIIVTGSYLVSRDRIRVHARLVNVETGKVENTAKIDGTLSDIFGLQDKVVFALMGGTEKMQIAGINPISLSAEDRKTIEEKPKPKADAYQWYSKGLELENTDPKEALVNFNRALDIDRDYTDAMIKAGFTAGNTLNLFNRAFEYLGRAEKVFRDRGETNTANYAALMKTIGTVYDAKGRLDRALEYYSRSQVILERLGLQTTTDYAYVMNNIGVVYGRKGQLDRALEYFLKDKFIEESLGRQDTVGYANAMNNIGLVYKMKGQLDQALEYFLRGKFIQDRLGLQNTADYAAVMNNIGMDYMSKGQFDRAREYYSSSKIIYERLGLQHTGDYANLMHNMGVLRQKMSR